MPNIRFRLAEILRKRYIKNGKSWDALARQIAKANKGSIGLKIDRRKLKRLCEGDNISLSIRELELLNWYLRKHNEGLDEKPIFSRDKDLIHSILESDNITIFVGARFHKEFLTEVVSRWDLRAIALFSKTELSHSNINIQDVVIQSDSRSAYEGSEWSVLLKSNEAKITIGSPLACPATEYALCAMVGEKPYNGSRSIEKKLLPFYFIFPDAHYKDYPSTFFIGQDKGAHLTAEEDIHLFKSIDTGRRGLFVLGELFISERIGTGYSLLIAQRQRASNQVTVCLSGTYATCTLALSRLITQGEIKETLPPITQDEHQPILVTVIESFTRPRYSEITSTTEKNTRENRKLDSQKIARTPRLLFYSNGKWIEK